ncbi:MAG: hypothetical protein ACUVX8_01445 [Candidatus Zipacnadales bacterium]
MLDTRHWEAFKPVNLSSMHISTTEWDAQATFVEGTVHPLPVSAWVFPNNLQTGQLFGLFGGTSAWKTNAPTILIEWATPTPVQGWVTSSTDPNDDNVGLWTYSDKVLAAWSYTIRSQKPVPGSSASLLSTLAW